MIRLGWILCLLIALLMPASAQQARSSQRKPAAKTSVRNNTNQKTTSTQQKRGTAAQQKKGTATQQQKGQQGRRGKKTQQPSVSTLQNERKKLQQDTEAKKKRKAQVEQNVRQGMNTLLVLNSEINEKRRTINTISKDIMALEHEMVVINQQIDTLSSELEDRKQRYMKSMRYLHRNRSIQNQMMFVFSADNFNQMYRRMRFTREYATFQRAQGDAVKQKQKQLSKKRAELAEAKLQKHSLLKRGREEQQQLEGKQDEQQKQVNALQQEQRALAVVIEQQQRQERELNARIEKMIAEEIARAKARAEAEARRKAEARKKAEAEAARKRQAELARKRAAAEAARKENERRIAQAKVAEEQAKAEARAAIRKSAQERAAAQRRAQQAEQARKQAEQKAQRDIKAREREIAEVSAAPVDDYSAPAADRMLTGGFEQNRGRLPMPVAGAYQILRTFGSNIVEGLRHVQLESKGIHIKTRPGTAARSIFDGEVSAVFIQGSKYVVMVRHGKYISVYCNLSSVSVSKGQRVTTRQTLGTIGSDGLMQFQLRNWTQLLNPMRWLGR